MNVDLAAATFLLATMVAGLGYVRRARDPYDAMISILLFGTTGIAVTLLLAYALDMPSAIDVALVFSVLAAIVGITFVVQTAPSRRSEKDR